MLMAMLYQQRIWADDYALRVDVIERMYRDLVQYVIEEELKQWQQPTLCRLRNILFKAMPTWATLRQFDWMLGHRV